MTKGTDDKDLVACRRCGSECRVETFPANGALQTDTTVWMCSHSQRLGGQCDEDAYLSAEAWNTRPEAADRIEQLSSALEKIANGEVDWTHKPADEMRDIASSALQSLQVGGGE